MWLDRSPDLFSLGPSSVGLIGTASVGRQLVSGMRRYGWLAGSLVEVFSQTRK